jgi:hypothetical protein
MDEVGKHFLNQLSDYLHQNSNQITCSGVYKIYFDFWDALKCYKGNSNGFTGLSELLILRVLLEYLGGGELEPLTKDVRYFKLKSYKDTLIAPDHPFPIIDETGKQKSCRPDITIYRPEGNLDSILNEKFEKIKRERLLKTDKVFSVIEVKVYLQDNEKTAKATFQKLSQIHDKYSKMRALFLIFDGLKEKKKKKRQAFQYLKTTEENNEWFSFLSLRDNNQSLSELFQAKLQLPQILLSE